MLNHVPVLGVAFGLALVGLSLWRKGGELKRVSLGFLIVVAALSIPAYLTGEPAEKIVEDLPGVSEDVIEQHEEAAQVAFVGVLILGAVALCGLIFFRGETRVPNWLSVHRAGDVRDCFRVDGMDGEPWRVDSTPRDPAGLSRGDKDREARLTTAGEIRLLISEPGFAKVEPDPPAGSRSSLFDPLGGPDVKHAEHTGKVGSVPGVGRRMRNEVVVIREDCQASKCRP